MSEINFKCKKCGEGCSGRKQFCSDYCKYWYRQIKKDNKRGLAPARKRNASFFFMVIGSEWAGRRGQGRRCGGMIRGAMAARVNVTIEKVVECTEENIRRHFAGIPGYEPTYMALGDGTLVKRAEVFEQFGVEL